MKIFFLASLFFQLNTTAQTALDFGEVKGKNMTACDEKKDGKICLSKNQFEISLLAWQSQTPVSTTVTLSYDGFNWKANRYETGWKKDSIKTFNLKANISYDSIFSALKKNNVFILPNQKELKVSGAVEDGTEYVLAYKAGNIYRIYIFNNVKKYVQFNKHIPEMSNYVNIENILFTWLTRE